MKSLGDKIVAYKKTDLERHVNALLRSIPTVNVESLPIAIEVIFDSIPGIKMTLESMDLLEHKFKVEAMVLAKTFMHRDLKVVVDTTIMNDRNPARYFMALAEEIGHIQLHQGVMLDIEDSDDFVALQAHARWKVAERDAKYYGRALLMPQPVLERLAREKYEGIIADHGFVNIFQFFSLLESHLALVFQVPLAEVRRRLDEYIGGIRQRIEISFASRSLSLVGLSPGLPQTIVEPNSLTHEQLFGVPLIDDKSVRKNGTRK